MSEVAIVHDAYTSDGGAERVATQLARIFEAPLYCTRVDESVVPDDLDVRELWTGRWADLFNDRRWWMPRTPYWTLRHLYRHQRATYAPELTEYETVIQTKGPVAPYVPPAEQTVVRYCHSPSRAQYDMFHDRDYSAPRRIWAVLQRLLRQTHRHYPDHWVANSEVVERRLHRYLGIDEADTTVVYPGVEVGKTGPQMAETGDFLLYLGRLAHNKRIPLLCQLARHVDRRVVVAGTGPEADTVAHGPDNIDHRGYVTEAEKWRLLSRAQATVFPAVDEDFGIVPIESMAAGTPVVGVREGFTKYQIYDGKNGALADPTVADLFDAVQRVRRLDWTDEQIAEFTEQFSVDRFASEMRDVVETARSEAAVSVDLKQPIPRAPALTDGGVEDE